MQLNYKSFLLTQRQNGDVQTVEVFVDQTFTSETDHLTVVEHPLHTSFGPGKLTVMYRPGSRGMRSYTTGSFSAHWMPLVSEPKTTYTVDSNTFEINKQIQGVL
jgi:hypothetical protein